MRKKNVWLNRPGQLADNSERAGGIFYILILINFFKYETIVSRNGLSLGYSEKDTISVTSLSVWHKAVVHWG